MECTVQDVSIYYEIHGEGTPILMIHGWSPDHRLMKGCMEPVFQSLDTKWKRVYFDLPGMGRTKGQPWITGSDQMLELIFGFIDAILPGQHFVLAGESYGGYLARGILRKRPDLVDGLLLICPSIWVDSDRDNGGRYEVLEADEALLEGLSAEDRECFQEEGYNTLLTRPVWERYREQILPGLRIADYPFLENCLGQHVPFSFDVDHPEKPFTKPALMLAGRQDAAVGFRGLLEIIDQYPRATLAVLDKAAHNLQIEQDVLFTALVKEWLDRVSAENA